jgi:hypothetical protein
MGLRARISQSLAQQLLFAEEKECWFFRLLYLTTGMQTITGETSLLAKYTLSKPLEANT